MAPNFLGLSTSGKPTVDWHAREAHTVDEQIPRNSGPVTTTLKSLPNDAHGLVDNGGLESIPSNSGSVKNNLGTLPSDAFGTP